MVQGHPWPKQVLGPVTLYFTYNFKWRDPRTRQEFASDSSSDGHCELSSMLVHLQRTSFIQPDFVLPYDLNDSRLYDFLGAVVPKLPFALAIKNFRRRVSLRDRPGFRLKRIPDGELAKLSEFVR
jgi:hypothetical protein